MTKLPIFAALAVAAAGLAAPAFAAPSIRTDAAPFCPTGNDVDYQRRAETLSTELQLSTKLNSTVDVSGGCLLVTTVANGKTTMAFYDPDSLKLVAEIG